MDALKGPSASKTREAPGSTNNSRAPAIPAPDSPCRASVCAEHLRRLPAVDGNATFAGEFLREGDTPSAPSGTCCP